MLPYSPTWRFQAEMALGRPPALGTAFRARQAGQFHMVQGLGI